MTITADARPLLALTMGDPVGVGPEIIVLALSDPAIYQACRPVVLGDLPALERARQALAPETYPKCHTRAGQGALPGRHHRSSGPLPVIPRRPEPQPSQPLLAASPWSPTSSPP